MSTSWYVNTFCITYPLGGESSITGGFLKLVDSPHKGSVMQSTNVAVVAGLNKLLRVVKLAVILSTMTHIGHSHAMMMNIMKIFTNDIFLYVTNLNPFYVTGAYLLQVGQYYAWL